MSRSAAQDEPHRRRTSRGSECRREDQLALHDQGPIASESWRCPLLLRGKAVSAEPISPVAQATSKSIVRGPAVGDDSARWHDQKNYGNCRPETWFASRDV